MITVSYTHLTTSHLIDKWLEQLCRKCVSAGLEEKNIKEIQSKLVNTLDKRGCLYIPKQVLNAEQAGLDYLLSLIHILVAIISVLKDVLDSYLNLIPEGAKSFLLDTAKNMITKAGVGILKSKLGVDIGECIGRCV